MVVGFLRGKGGSASRLKPLLEQQQVVGVSAVSVFELLHPLYYRKLTTQEKVVKSFFHQLKLLPLDSAAAEESAHIMASLLRIGEPVNALDVLIAGTAVSNGADRIISMDNDYHKIAKVSQLKVEVIGGEGDRPAVVSNRGGPSK